MGYDFFQGDDVSNEQQSELDIYLHEPLLDRKKNLDIIDFWKFVQYRYPKLSMMARDVLAIPLTIVASESAFSTAGRTLDKYRNSLLPENVEALICCRDWVNGAKLKNKSNARKKEFDDINAEMLKLKIDLNPTTTSGQASNDVEVEDVGDEDDEVESLDE
ncbi:hypothetical protein Scep_021623 [Stephania cephalantha]|uniref:HAT C-terminal dimerisation domain-containing protein n=1 Tax=Stephania cephalantha TaxID=152367 RepID=A0AAP0F4P0_9MAGN